MVIILICVCCSQEDLDDLSLTEEDVPASTKTTPLKNSNNNNNVAQKNSEPINVVSARTTPASVAVSGSPISSPRSLNESHSLSRLLSKDDDPLLYKELVSRMKTLFFFSRLIFIYLHYSNSISRSPLIAHRSVIWPASIANASMLLRSVWRRSERIREVAIK